MIWFLSFTTVGLGIFVLFLALKKVTSIPLKKWLGGFSMLGIMGFLSYKYNSESIY